MSALGQKQTYAVQNGMSALPPIATAKAKFPQTVMSALPLKADMCGALAHVRFGPKADIWHQAMLMQSRNSMGFQCLDDAVEDQTNAYCRDKEADDAGNGINPHRTQLL
jgi:hypothetical protein